jgi:peptide/nickel transport system substrate-binding protein
MPQPGSVLRMAHDLSYGGAETMDPYDPNSFWPPISLVFGRLVRADEQGHPIPDLAASWRHSDDGRVWTFELRPGVRFHDGSTFDSGDVVYSLRRVLDPKLDSPLRAALALVEEVQAEGELTVVVRLESAEFDLPALLTDYRMVMIAEGSAETLRTAPVGTGPFSLAVLDPEGTTVLAANPDYWGGRPGVDRVEVVAIPDVTARVLALQSGLLDFLDSVSPTQEAVFRRDPRFVVQSFPTGDWNGIAMRIDTPPFDDVRVRKALRMAVDRPTLTKLVLGPLGGTVSCDNPVWPGDPYWLPEKCGRELEGARELMAEAGYAAGLDVDLYTSDVEENLITLATVFQNQVAEIGVRARILVVPADGYWNDVWMKESLVVTSWGQRPAPQILNEEFRSGSEWNDTFWLRPDFDELLDAARSSPELDARRAYYQAAQRLLFEEGGLFVPYYKNRFRVFARSVENVDPVLSDHLRWERITVDRKGGA